MYQIKITKIFRKDTERCRKRGYNMELLKEAVRILEAEGKLPSTYRPHKLSGNLEAAIPVPSWKLPRRDVLVSVSYM